MRDADLETTSDVPAGASWFEAFEAEGLLQLRVALVSAFGAEVGEESAADVVTYAWEHRERLAAMRNPKGYLFRVGQTAARRHRRRWQTVELPAVEAATVDEIHPDLPIALAKLTDRQRRAVVLVHVNGWTLEDTAAAMDIDISTVRTHIRRGLERLERLLNDVD